MKKQIISMLVVLTLSMSMVLTGCSSKEDTVNSDTVNEKSTTEIINLKMSIKGSEEDQAIYRERLDAAEANIGNVKVELIYVPGDQYDQKLLTMIASNTMPDIMQLTENVHNYSVRGELAPLDQFVKDNNVNLTERFGTAHETYVYESNLYAMPDRGGAMLLYYNKDMFDKAGVSYPTKDWTWDDMLDASQKLTIKNGDVTEQYGFAAGDWWPWWMSFIYQNGGRILDDNNKVVINSPETIEALEFYNDLVYKYGVAPSPVDYGNLGTGNISGSPDPLFAQGKTAMEMTGFWNIGSLNNVPDLNWDIAPVWGQKQNATTSFGSGLAISSKVENKEMAFKVIEYLTSVEGQMPIVTNKQDAPANKAVLESEAFLKGDFSNTPIDMDAFAQSSDMLMKLPLGPWWSELEKVCKDHLAELFMNEKDAETVVAELEKDLVDMMGRY